MKKILFITTLLVGLSLTANAKIQDTFLGLLLGKSSRADVKRELKYRGFFDISKDKENPEYLGEYKHLGVKFYDVKPSYTNDTLSSITFCVEADKNKYQTISQKLQKAYKKYSALDTTMVQIGLISDGPISEGVGIFDGETQVICALTDSLLICKYTALGYVGRKLLSALEELKDLDVVHGFAGVKFGDPRYSVMTEMRRRTLYEPFNTTDREVSYLQISIGGRTFDFATFYFKPGKGLVAALMYKAFELTDQAKAIEFYNDICFQYQKKYTNFVSLDKEEEEDKWSVCGRTDLNVANEDTKFPIWIRMKKEKNKNDKYMYYVHIEYYITNTLDIYDSDI